MSNNRGLHELYQLHLMEHMVPSENVVVGLYLLSWGNAHNMILSEKSRSPNKIIPVLKKKKAKVYLHSDF